MSHDASLYIARSRGFHELPDGRVSEPHEGVQEVLRYRCAHCRLEYARRGEARTCAARGFTPDPRYSIGVIVTLGAGFGWFDGDPWWVQNYAPLRAVDRPSTCPNKNKNCFSPCCTYQFFYALAAITADVDDPHLTVYRFVTLAMTPESGHQVKTVSERHGGRLRATRVTRPPAHVVKTARSVIDART